MKKFIEEFKTFAMRGSVIDLAVAVVIGAAFGKIVTSLVDNVITPLLSLVAGGIDLSELVIHIGSAAVRYGTFVQSVIDFLIIAFAIFVVVRAMNKLKKQQEEEPEKAPEPAEEVKLLREIRDSLKRE